MSQHGNTCSAPVQLARIAAGPMAIPVLANDHSYASSNKFYAHFQQMQTSQTILLTNPSICHFPAGLPNIPTIPRKILTNPQQSQHFPINPDNPHPFPLDSQLVPEESKGTHQHPDSRFRFRAGLAGKNVGTTQVFEKHCLQQHAPREPDREQGKMSMHPPHKQPQ